MTVFRDKKDQVAETMGILQAKLAEVNRKKQALFTQLQEAKDHIIAKVRGKLGKLQCFGSVFN